MSVTEKVEKISVARGLSRFFKIELTLSMFGKVILHWVYPPQSEEV